MLESYFRYHGEFCASYPLEVIVSVVTSTICILSFNKSLFPYFGRCGKQDSSYDDINEYHGADVVLMTIIRCTAVLYCYHQFRKLHRIGSKYILGIAGLFTVISSFIFSCTVMNILHLNVSDLKDALFFFFLLIDLSKATLLAQHALTASSTSEANSNIAIGISTIGPSLTLDTLVEALVIGIGTLSGVRRIEVLCSFAVVSVLVNYVMMMTFYPAVLSLVLELLRNKSQVLNTNHFQRLASVMKDLPKSNPVVDRVKLIMAAGLLCVHVQSRWYGEEDKLYPIGLYLPPSRNASDDGFHFHFLRWVSSSSEQLVILVILLTLTAKYIFFEHIDYKLWQPMKSGVSYEKPELPRDRPSPPLPDAIPSQPSLPRKPSIKDATVVDKPTDPPPKVCFYFEDNVTTVDECNQTETFPDKDPVSDDSEVPVEPRNPEMCLQVLKESPKNLIDQEVLCLIKKGFIKAHQLESVLDDPTRGVAIRRKMIQELVESESFSDIPYLGMDYSKVMGACCENVIGFTPVPVGVAGPLRLDDCQYYVPMATTEGCLIASTNRGCVALRGCGVRSCLLGDGMSRGPVLRMPSACHAGELLRWLEEPDNMELVKSEFDSTSRFGRLQDIKVRIAGRLIFLRFVATTGDAMGMNMLSKGTEHSIRFLQDIFPNLEVVSLSGNYCTDKKAAAINWINGRGKSVVCEAVVPANVIKNLLKTTAHKLVDLNIQKNLVGSGLSGTFGGFNAHAANIVAAIYIATGQDPAQVVTSSNCMTLMETWGPDDEDLYISCTMPSLELASVGGGTILPAQGACLDIMHVRGSDILSPGGNASRLACIVCATVLAGELSLMAALAAGQLVRSHLRLNRSFIASGKKDSSAS